MSNQKPSIPRGTRDFSPAVMTRRNYIFDTIKKYFKVYGFQPVETPAMEQLSVLTGKYGDEGDKLIFKILNSGDFAGKIPEDSFVQDSRALTPAIAEKALRYDLTVPFARYVVMNRNEITLPFRRYQIQPVWRADRPQKGRYREFYQCDADIIGTDSLLPESEYIFLLNDVLRDLGINDFTIKVNNRKILSGIAEIVGKKGHETDLCVALDKLDKIGKEKVTKELSEKGFSDDALQKLDPVFTFTGSNEEKISKVESLISESEEGLKGVKELKEVIKLTEHSGRKCDNVEFDLTLARGLNYYTGAIFEVKANNVKIGSICGGGRYADLTGVFGMPGLSGAGISFGVDRIYDVMEELKLFPEQELGGTKVMISVFDQDAVYFSTSLVYKLREAGVPAELYPEPVKIKKQFNYANSNNIPFVLVIGSEEMKTGNLSLKNMKTGDQEQMTLDQVIQRLS